MKYQYIILFIFFSLHPFLCFAQEEFESKKGRQTVGWIEKVKVSPGGLILHAKLDPGSNSSSLYAENIKKLRKNKKLWTSFELSDQYGTSAKITREIIRSEKIKGLDGKTREEHVVTLGMCLGKMYFEDELRITSKKNEQYDMKLGRQALEGNVLIDPSSKLTSAPECGEKGKDLGPVEEASGEGAAAGAE